MTTTKTVDNFIFFLQNITITVTSDGQVIKNNSPTCFLNFHLMLSYFIIHSLSSGHFQVSSSKNNIIFNNYFIFLAFSILISNNLVGFLCHLFSINNSAIFNYITPFFGASFSVSTFMPSSCYVSSFVSVSSFFSYEIRPYVYI